MAGASSLGGTKVKQQKKAEIRERVSAFFHDVW